MSDGLLIILLSVIAGIGGTGLGGIIGFFAAGKGARLMSLVLAFAGGVMAGVVAFEMIPETLEAMHDAGMESSAAVAAVAAVLGGAGAIFLVHLLIDKISKKQHGLHVHPHGPGCVHSVDVSLLLKHAETEEERLAIMKSMKRAGIIMLAALAVHNLPEGVAIGAAGVASLKTGIVLTILLALHNIPEGMAICAPLAGGGMSKGKALLMTVLAGAVTVAGCCIGVILGGINQLASGICMGLAGGAMLQVTFVEIMPEAFRMEKSKAPALALILGFAVSMLIVFVHAH
jgi:ZIP family zinc transporter